MTVHLVNRVHNLNTSVVEPVLEPVLELLEPVLELLEPLLEPPALGL